MRYIVRMIEDGVTYFLTPRRRIIRLRYKCRTEWSTDIDDAKIFQTKSAATLSGRANVGWQAPGCDDPFEVIPVALVVVG